jgi:quinol monooxygenase YgiN
MTPGITQLVQLTARPGCRDEILDLLREVVSGAADESGTHTYAVYTTTAPDTIWLFEQYSDDNAFQTHMSAPALAKVYPRLMQLRVGPPEVLPLTLVAEKH